LFTQERRREVSTYEVLLGIDRAAKDTKRRVTMQVREADPLSAAITAEELVDGTLMDPVEYSHAMAVRPVRRATPVGSALPLAMAA